MMESEHLNEHGPMPDILLVEDNPLHVRLVRSMLADIWPDVEDLRHARKLEAAVEEVRAYQPECILLDLILPDAEGLQAVNALLAEAPQVPIVVLSAHEDDSLAVQAVSEGAQDYLVKGTIGPEALAKSIQFAIQRHRLDRHDEALGVAVEAATEAAGVTVLDGNGVVLFAEGGVAEMLGLEVSDIVGVSLADLSHQNDLAAVVLALESAEGELTVRMWHASGSELKARVELRPLSDGASDSAAVIARYTPESEAASPSSGPFAVMSDWVGA